mmetsp:Transcript_7180/g.29842  ORF Transcript_7180/g.29842 Transcript_7180/m.29842 type:complete len:388 (+) Transcript_7180:96-1259(+)
MCRPPTAACVADDAAPAAAPKAERATWRAELEAPGSAIRQLAFSLGVLACFSVSSLSQEALTARHGFRHERFLVLAQSIAAAGAAAVALLIETTAKTTTPDEPDKKKTPPETAGTTTTNNGALLSRRLALEWAVVVGAYYASHYFGLASLRHLSYPVHVTFKSCKAIPVAIGERLLTTRRHSAAKTVGVAAMCVGAAVFLLAGDSAGARKRGGDTSALGIALVVLALVFDGVYAGSQVTLVARCPSEFLLMLYMNAAQAVLAMGSAVAFGGLREFATALDELRGLGQSAELAVGSAYFLRRDLLAFALSKALGTLCVYRLLRESGTLVVATVTTLRKVLSVSLSVVAFGHALSPLQCLGLLLVFLHKYVGQFLVGYWPRRRRTTKAE